MSADEPFCDHCGLDREECQRKSLIVGVCYEYNKMADDKEAMRITGSTVKPLDITDKEFMEKRSA